MNSVPRIELSPGYSISRIINGCWQLTPDHGGGPGSEKATHRIFAELVDAGFTTFDCADIYIGVEESIGRFRKSLANPDSIQIHTKYAANKDTLHELTNEKIDAAVDRSLQRLGVERLDLLQFHWWNYEVPGLENMTERLVRAQKAGKIRLLGVTNFDTDYVRSIVEGGAELVSIQTQYSLIDRRPEKKMTTLSRERGVRLLPYGVLAGGFLSERYLDAPSPENMNRSLQKYRLMIDEMGGWALFQRLLHVLSDIAKKHDTKISTIAAGWALNQPEVVAINLGTGSTSRAAQNTDIGELRLDNEDRKRIDEQLALQAIAPGDMYDIERDTEGRHSKIIKMNLHESSDNV